MTFKNVSTKASTEDLNIATTVKMAILRYRNLDEMEATRYRIKSMIRGKFEIMDGIRRATKLGSMDFKTGWKLHRESKNMTDERI